MLSKFVRWMSLGAVVCFVAVGGCAAERAPINRVQAAALDKHFFVGPSLSDT